MISLQSDLTYANGETPLVPEAGVDFRHPLYNALIANNEAGEVVLESVGQEKSTLWLNLSDKTYSVSIPSEKLFGPKYGDVVAAYLVWLLKRDNGKPKLQDLGVTFEVGYADESKGAVRNLEAIWFHTALKGVTRSSNPDHNVRRFVSPDSAVNGSTDEANADAPNPVEATNIGLRPSRFPLKDFKIPRALKGIGDAPWNVAAIETFRLNAAAVVVDRQSLVNKGLYAVNRAAYYEILHSLFPGIAMDKQPILLFIVNLLIDLSGDHPSIARDSEQERHASVRNLLNDYELPIPARLFDDMANNFARLFNFPLNLPEIKPLSLAGKLSVDYPISSPPATVNFDLYHLTMEYTVNAEVPKTLVGRYFWDSTQVRTASSIVFRFEEKVPQGHVSRPVKVKVKSFNGSDIYSANFSAKDPLLQNLDIHVPLQNPLTIGSAEGADTNGPSNMQRLRGKIVSLSKLCSLKGTVVIESKIASDASWVVVSSGTSDADGSFTMPYPYGKFVAAQARAAVDPESITPLQMTPESGSEAASISSDFIFLFVNKSGSDAEKKSDDCGCNASTKAGRLPSQEDLMQSNQFTQDLGSGCVNLSTPNRTLREFNYHAIVRHTDPEVGNYELESQSIEATEAEPFPKTSYTLRRRGKIERDLIDIDNPLEWQDVSEISADLTIYQAVTVATGHILHYKSEFKVDGYSLGDLVYSLPLAPGQKKQIVTIDASHSLLGSETQAISQGEKLAASLLNERNIIDQIAGSVGEALAGSSSATTSGVSGGLGAAGSMGAFGASLGVAGGYSNANSRASQQGSRNVSQFFSEKLRQSIQQNASSYRQLNATAVTAVQEGQKYNAVTDVVSNHNHCHSMTMMYFEVLRHFAIFQKLVDVEECVFVPFLMTRFSLENISKWADALAPRLLPLHANTFIQPAIFSVLRNTTGHPLRPAFDAVDRVRTNWMTVDYPKGQYCDEVIEWVEGEMQIVANIPRPITRYDNILSLPVMTKEIWGRVTDPRKAIKDAAITVLTGGLFGGDGKVDKLLEVIETRAQIFSSFMKLDENYTHVPPSQCIRITSFEPIPPATFEDKSINVDPVNNFFDNDADTLPRWLSYAELLGFGGNMVGLKKLLNKYFKDQLIGDWDVIWFRSLAPQIFTKLLGSLRCNVTGNFDTTQLGAYQYFAGDQIVNVAFNGGASIVRRQVDYLRVWSVSAAARNLAETQLVFTLQRMDMRYSTAHYNGVLFRGSMNGDILDKLKIGAPADSVGARARTPVTASEKQNPRMDDKYMAQRLITHLNQNLEYYNRILWYSLDSNRRYLLLDGFKIETFDKHGVHEGFRSLASVLKNAPVAVVGNAMVFPVAPGYHVNQALIVAADVEGETRAESLLDHYKPDIPPPPYRLSIPTRGVFSEAILGQCDSCEKAKPDSSQDWTKFTTDEPTPINPLTAPVPTVTDWRANFKDFAPPMISIQNAPGAPDPGSGLKGISELLGKSDIFKDVTGLDANQKNALQTYLSNQENVKAMAQMATGMAMQAHNTQNSPQMMDSMKQANAEGVLDKNTYGQLVKSHFQQQIDGGTSLKAEIDEKKNQGKLTLRDAAVEAARSGSGEVKASFVDDNGNAESMSLLGTRGAAPGGTTATRTKPPNTRIVAEVKNIFPIHQEKEGGCWAAALTMMVSWKKQRNFASIEDVLRIPSTLGASGGPMWLEVYNEDHGLLPPHVSQFLHDFELAAEGPQASFAPEKFVELLNDYGPLYIALSMTGNIINHAVCITRIEVETPSSPTSPSPAPSPPTPTSGAQPQFWFTFFDPYEPVGTAEKTLEFKEFTQRMEKLYRILSPLADALRATLWQIFHFKDKLPGR